MRTKIQWTDRVWNPVRGCSLVSAGCANCYAIKQAHRFSGPGMPYEGLTELGPQGPRWNGTIRLVREALEEPLHWKTPRRVFVNSMSDLFHEDVPDNFIIQVFFAMAVTPRHTYQILTKRPERMRAVCSGENMLLALATALTQFTVMIPGYSLSIRHNGDGIDGGVILPNVWLGVSVEDQATADERIPILLRTPAAVRFISAEPLLGPIDLDQNCYLPYRGNVLSYSGLDWVILGGELGSDARPSDLAWIRSIKAQCQAAKVPVFVNQLGANIAPIVVENNSVKERLWLKERKGGDMAEWPLDLQVREYPR